MLYLLPIGRAMVETEWSRGQARSFFERVREKQHPVTVASMERLLKQANL
jgi:hypothetical protein